MSPITPQQAFDAALLGIRAQNYKRSLNGVGCEYRGSKGLKCGIGHALPDELCVLNGVSIDKPNGCDADIASLLRDTHWGARLSPFFSLCEPEMLVQMQEAHDSSLSPVIYTNPAEIRASFERHMASIAKDYGLTYTPPKLT